MTILASDSKVYGELLFKEGYFFCSCRKILGSSINGIEKFCIFAFSDYHYLKEALLLSSIG